MFNVLTGLAMGIVIFAITIGVGVIVLARFGGANASCPDIGVTEYTFNYTLNQCANDTNTAVGAYDPTNAAWINTNYLVGDLGTSGLAGWTAAIVALAVGLLFIGALMGKRKY